MASFLLLYFEVPTLHEKKRLYNCVLIYLSFDWESRSLKVQTERRTWRNVIHEQSRVCCGNWTRWISTADGNCRQDFYDRATFHSSQSISHRTEVSVSSSLLSLLFFLLCSACLF